MTDPLAGPLSAEDAADTDAEVDADGDADDPVEGADGLPDDVLNDDLDDPDDPDDPIVDVGPLTDTDVDAKVVDLEDADDDG